MMRFLTRLALALSILGLAAQAETSGGGSTYESKLGFTVELPVFWLPLQPTGSDLRELEADPRFAGLDPKILGPALQKMRSGEFEFFFREPFDDEFTENIAIRRRQLDLPSDKETLSKECAAIPASVRESTGRTISPPVCEIRSVAGNRATYMQIEGLVPGTFMLQYQIQAAPQDVLAMTATVLSRNLPSMRSEFDSIVASLRLRPRSR